VRSMSVAPAASEENKTRAGEIFFADAADEDGFAAGFGERAGINVVVNQAHGGVGERGTFEGFF
jgi:hypothetical protein